MHSFSVAFPLAFGIAFARTCYGVAMTMLEMVGLALQPGCHDDGTISISYTDLLWKPILSTTWLGMLLVAGELTVGTYFWHTIWASSSSFSALAHLMFVTFLTINIFTDTVAMVLFRYTTFGLGIVGLGASYLHLTPITLPMSLVGCTAGYILLWGVKRLCLWWRNVDGIGQGDLELLAGIGAWTGPITIWSVLCIACSAATLWALCPLIWRGNHVHKLPLGTFLSLSALLTPYVTLIPTLS